MSGEIIVRFSILNFFPRRGQSLSLNYINKVELLKLDGTPTVRTADTKMVQQIAQGRRTGKDSNLIKAKILLEDKLGVPKSWFAQFGREGKPQSVIDLYKNKLNELEQQGFGMLGHGIQERHLRAID